MEAAVIANLFRVASSKGNNWYYPKSVAANISRTTKMGHTYI